MTDLDIDYSSITELDLSCKGLTELPDLSIYPNLIELDCSDNYISNLDNLPLTLEIIYCNSNEIRQLYNLPPNLEILHCGYNKITHLNNLPPNLKELKCANNPLIYDFEPTLENIRKHNAKGT